MPVDFNLVYGEMFGSAVLHGVLPSIVTAIYKRISPVFEIRDVQLVLMLVVPLVSVVAQGLLIASLQASSCGGVRSFSQIGIAALIAGVLTAGLIAIPTYAEPIRLMVSQLFKDHYALRSPLEQQKENVIAEAGEKIRALDAQEQVGGGRIHQKGGASLTKEEYDAQTVSELNYGTGYWAAWAGAYGIAAGTYLAATNCPAS